MFVHPEHEHQGYGTKLMVKICEAMDERRAHGFAVASRDGAAFYSQFGFRPGVSFRIINGNFSGGLVGMVRKPFARQIPRALPDTGPSQQPQASEEAAQGSGNASSTEEIPGANCTEKPIHVEGEVDKIVVSMLDKVLETQRGGAAFSNSELYQIMDLCITALNPGDTIESFRAREDSVVKEAIKRVTAMKVMKTIKRLEGRSGRELGDAGGSQVVMAGRVEELKRIFGRVRVREGGTNGE
jgi:hypothetical protein